MLLDDLRSALLLFISIEIFGSCRWNGAIPAKAAPNILDDYVERWYQQQGQDSRTGESTYHNDSQWPGDEDSCFTKAQRHGCQGKNCGNSSHQNGTQAATTTFNHSGSSIKS